MEITKFFIENYINKFSENDYIGVEIEMPIISLNSPYIVNSKVIEGLFSTFLDNEEFKIENYDNEKNIISIKNIKTNDTVSLEYSFNIIELSLGKELLIDRLKEKFDFYYNFIEQYLEKYEYEIYCGGINPNYHYIDKTCLNQDRYKVIERLLTNSSNSDLYNQFCSYCCSIQTHINTSKNNIVNLINMLSKVENNKMEIFSNSYMKETNLKNSRKYLWENSNFGPSNVGTNPNYNNLEDLLNDYSKRNLFFVERNNKFLLLNAKQPLNKYLDKKRVKATDEYGKTCYVVPSYSDFDNFRSYRSVELTKYGTLEIRSDCTQSKENIFKLIAFNVGICKNHLKILKYLDMNKKITNERLIEFCIKGLKMRNFGEEKYMEVSNDQEKNRHLDV